VVVEGWVVGRRDVGTDAIALVQISAEALNSFPAHPGEDRSQAQQNGTRSRVVGRWEAGKHRNISPNPV